MSPQIGGWLSDSNEIKGDLGNHNKAWQNYRSMFLVNVG